ncbi:MAG: addiction module protein [Ignavibacteria bacterium]|nr:addiction module protein [Ignavibacteria bacterium]
MNDKLRTQINNLSVSEKILLVEEIWDSIASKEESFDLTDAQRKTILERSNELNENPKMGRRWEEIRDEFLGKK